MKRKEPTYEENNIQASASAYEPIAPEKVTVKSSRLYQYISIISSDMMRDSFDLKQSRDSIKDYIASKGEEMTQQEKELFTKHFELIERRTQFFPAELDKISDRAFNLSRMTQKLWPVKYSEDESDGYDSEDSDQPIETDLLAKPADLSLDE